MTKWPTHQLALLLILAWTTGCSRQLTVPDSPSATPKSNQLPFDRTSDDAGISPTSALASGVVPVGTDINIKLQLVLSSAEARTGASFAAVLDDPVVIGGKTLVPQGTPVTGTVLAARASERLSDPGYLRLTLANIAVNGKPLILQTSSIFAKGRWYDRLDASAVEQSKLSKIPVAETEVDSRLKTQAAHPASDGNIRFSTGHRFTFRLTQPLHLQG